MTDHPLSTIEFEDELKQRRLYSHSVGICSEKRERTKYKGKVWYAQWAGSASALMWGSHKFIFTAKHLVKGLSVADLRLWFCPVGPELTERERNGCNASELGSEFIECSWEDLAILPVTKTTGLYPEFHDVYLKWIDPKVRQALFSVGFPTDLAQVVRKDKVMTPHGELPHEYREITTYVWESRRIRAPRGFRPRLTDDIPYNPNRHYLASWDFPMTLGPFGYSGAAMWKLEFVPIPVIKLDLHFAGVPTHFYQKPHAIERIIKASVVRKFLEETFGPAQ